MSHKSRANRSSTAVSIVRTPAQTAITIPTRKLQHKVAPPSTRDRRPRSRAQNSAPSACIAYINTLNDPFMHGPVRLGWGTMIPTGLGTCFYRNILTATADGSMGIFIEPSIALSQYSGSNFPIQFNVAGASTVTWSKNLWSNSTAFNGLADAARIVSVGLKVIPMIAATATPGILYTGSIDGGRYGDLGNISITNLISSPYLTPGFGTGGGFATSRPIDPRSFTFSDIPLLGPTVGQDIPVSIPMVLANGYPNGTSFFVEAVLNFEYEYAANVVTSAAASPLEGGLQTNEQSLMTKAFNNVESMWNTVKKYLLPSGITEGVSSLMATGATAIGRMLLPSGSSSLPRLMSGALPRPILKTPDEPPDAPSLVHSYEDFSSSSSSTPTESVPPVVREPPRPRPPPPIFVRSSSDSRSAELKSDLRR